MNNKVTPFLLTLALLVAAWFTLSPKVKAADIPAEASEEVSTLLADVKAEAHQLERDNEELKTFVQSATPLSWHSHATKLNEIREHINKTGQLLTNLNEARDQASPWQQRAIDEIRPLLQELANNTEATINHLSEYKDRINLAPDFSDYVTANHDLSRELAALVTDYVDYGKHQAEFQRLQEKLQVTTK